MPHLAIKNLTPTLFLVALIWLCYRVLEGFFTSIAWAVVIAYITWPLFLRLKATLRQHANLSALLATLVIASFILSLLYWVGVMLQNELHAVYPAITAFLSQPSLETPAFIKAIPWLDSAIQDYIRQINVNELSLKSQILDWSRQAIRQIGGMLGNLGKHIFQLGFTLMTVFFCYRDGDKIISQLKQGTAWILGDYQSIYLKTAGDTAQAVVFGLVLAAMSQGLIAAIGYRIAGVNAPILLGVATALLAIVPFGATLIWLPASIGLALSGQLWEGIGLFLWGVLLISTVDNIIRPLVISGTSRVPFLVVMFGVFGGLSAFGGVGLFLGPVILSVALAVWRAWLGQQGRSG
jgi:P-type Ca2+ transporter type 2C